MYTSAAELTGVRWRRSRHSGAQGNCVELGSCGDAATGRVAVRNSRFPDGPALLLSRSDLAGFLAQVKAGRYDDLVRNPG